MDAPRRVARILVVDDHEMVREGLRILLERDVRLKVLAGAATGTEAVTLARDLRPDVVVMDLALPELSGIDATGRIRAALPETQVVILSGTFTSEHVFQALRAGAIGYVVKQAAAAELIEAVLAAVAGRRFLSAQIAQSLEPADLDLTRRSPLERLSAREREVLQLAVMGWTSAEIARKLFLSPKTVDTYRRRVMDKLCVSDHSALVRFAMEHELVPR